MTTWYTLRDLIADADLRITTAQEWARRRKIPVTLMKGRYVIHAKDYPTVVEKCRIEIHGREGYIRKKPFCDQHGVHKAKIDKRIKRGLIRTVSGLSVTLIHEQDALDSLLVELSSGRKPKPKPEPKPKPKAARPRDICPYAGCSHPATVRIWPGRGFTFCPRHAEQNRKLLKIEASD